MKKLFIISAAALFLGFNAQAEVKPYVSGKVNFNFQDYDVEKYSVFDSSDSISGGSFALGFAGYKNLPIRAEFEFNLMGEAKDEFSAYGFDVIAKGKIDTYMLNFYYDFYNQTNFIPYITVGLGVAKAEISLVGGYSEDNYKDTATSYQYGIGSYYKINDNLLADFVFRVNKTNNIDTDSTKTDITNFNFSLGLRYNL